MALPVRRRMSQKQQDPAVVAIPVHAPEVAAVPARRRLTGKQPAPAFGLAASHAAAIADEGWSELVALSSDVRRKHIHWTHVRTSDPEHVQPGQLSRQDFWVHLERVYKDVYPEPANRSGSILLFGAVVKELHAESAKAELRDEHHHAPVYCTKQHYWSRVAQVSLERYNIKMHAACHDGYTSMYQYVRSPTAKKPLPELDAEIFLSPDHPRGDALRRLLEAGARSSQNRQGPPKRARGGDAGGGGPKRIRVADVYELVRAGGFRHALALQAHAEGLARQGDSALAEFCTTHGTVRLQDHLNAAWAVIDAPCAMAAAPTRLGKLRECAASRSCICDGTWKAGAAFVLENNGEDVRRFGRYICRALAIGAKRGANIAVIGVPGSGKSTILQPLESIFHTLPPPQEGSTFPLSGLPDAEILLWQDFEFHPGTMSFMDMLRLLVGERVGIRIPGQQNVSFNNKAPLFYSALQKIAPPGQPARRASMEYQRKVQAMDERFTIRNWAIPLPLNRRVPDFPQCAKCFASFVLENDAAWHLQNA